jgi:hypothetical protein
MNNIAIIDFLNHDIGINILFPKVNYFILEENFDKTAINSKYDIKPIVHNKHVNVFEHISNNNYDTIFVIAPLYNSVKQYNGNKNDFYTQHIDKKLSETINCIKNNKFNTICFFDNYDYDYDPNIIFEKEFITTNNILFFKRYYNKEKSYQNNVFPFPYIIFGHQCNIDMVTDLFYKNKEEKTEKINRLFFSGSLINHLDTTYGVYRNRIEILQKMKTHVQVYNPGRLQHDQFMKELSNSKYCLDLLGVGDPNIRTFEILCSKSLRISQRSNLKWNFNEEFCEETIFDDENDLLQKITNLEKDHELYRKCLDNQNNIVKTHMNKDVLRSYIVEKIEKNDLCI